MPRRITQRELRNDSGEIMDGLDRGESFVVTRAGKEVAELTPAHARRFVPTGRALAVFAGSPPIDSRRFRIDVDAALSPKADWPEQWPPPGVRDP